MNAQQSLLQKSSFKWWEILLWIALLSSPAWLPKQALIINEIAIVALFAVSLDLILGYTGIVSLGHAAFLVWAAMPLASWPSTSPPTRCWAWPWARPWPRSQAR